LQYSRQPTDLHHNTTALQHQHGSMPPQYIYPEDKTSSMETSAPTQSWFTTFTQRRQPITRDSKTLGYEHATTVRDSTRKATSENASNPASKRPAASAPTTTEASPPKRAALDMDLPPRAWSPATSVDALQDSPTIIWPTSDPRILTSRSPQYSPSSPVFYPTTPVQHTPRSSVQYSPTSPLESRRSSVLSHASSHYSPASPSFYPRSPMSTSPAPDQSASSLLDSAASPAYASESPRSTTRSPSYAPGTPAFPSSYTAYLSRSSANALESLAYSSESPPHSPATPRYSSTPSSAASSPLQYSPLSPENPTYIALSRWSWPVPSDLPASRAPSPASSQVSPTSISRPIHTADWSSPAFSLLPSPARSTQFWDLHSQRQCPPSCLPALRGHAVGCDLHSDLFLPLPMLRTDGTLQNSGEVYNANGTLENSGGVPLGCSGMVSRGFDT